MLSFLYTFAIRPTSKDEQDMLGYSDLMNDKCFQPSTPLTLSVKGGVSTGDVVALQSLRVHDYIM